MENYTQDMSVLKREEKDMLLTNKDPHLSHLFEHNGPHTPNSVSTDGIVQAPLQVEANYPGDGNKPNYQLFDMPGGSYMTDASKMPSSNNQSVAEQHAPSVPFLKNSNLVEFPKQPIKNLSGANISQSWNGLVGTGQPNTYKVSMRPSDLIVSTSTAQVKPSVDGDNKVMNPQLISPPADHYNMQLLAHSAQQQQLLLQQQQQELYGQGSSSAALQQLAKLRQQDMIEVRLKPSNSPFQPAQDELKANSNIKPQFFVEARNQPGILAVPLSSSSLTQPLRKSPYHISSSYTGWPLSERGTPDYIRSHTRDLSFGSQDSPVIALHPADVAKTSTKIFSSNNLNKTLTNQLSSKTEPELKSPLDHPEHQLDRHRNRFFSSDSGAASGSEQQGIDDEAPLNERDKKAAAALSELLEQSEKPTPSSHVGVANPVSTITQQSTTVTFSPSSDVGSVASKRILQLQHETLRSTPPPAYEQSVLPDQNFHSFLQPAHSNTPFPVPPALLPMASSVKQEQMAPITSAQGFVHALTHSQPEQSLIQQIPQIIPMSEHNPLLMYHQVPETAVQMRTSVDGSNSSTNVTTVPVGLPVQTDPYGPLRSIANDVKSGLAAPAKVTAGARTRRTSSSGSQSARRKSDGNLTCGLCGHSFRSTPALNGHMRVHSTADKKQNKEERQIRSVSSDHSTAVKNNITRSFSDIAKSQAVITMSNSLVGITPSHSFSSETHNHSQTKPHNGLLTMASAACFLKTEPHTEHMQPASVLPQAYVVPHVPMLFQQPSVVNVFNSNFPENSAKAEPGPTSDNQNVNYSQLYASTFQQGLPFSNINFLPNMSQVSSLVPQDTLYPVDAQQQGMTSAVQDGNMQGYVNQQPSDGKPLFGIPQDDGYPHRYDPQQLVHSNTLSQLASIAVATANRDNMSDIPLPPTDFSSNFSQNQMQSTAPDTINGPEMSWMTPAQHGAQENCIPQQQIYSDPNLTSETSPIRSGHDPFILPVSAPMQDQQQFGGYDPNQPSGNVLINTEPTVTWKDNLNLEHHPSPLLTSLDDSLMRDAVDVANPSKILPNSMMGGNPSVGTLFSGSRPFRQRHHSEGAHLIKSSGSSILKEILHSPVSNVKLRVNKNEVVDDEVINVKKTDNVQENKNLSVDAVANIPPPPPSSTAHVEEYWAEPKPVQRRIRQRRHSADCRLLLKSGQFAGSRHAHLVNSPTKKTNIMRKEVRARRRPPPLVIPSSVNTLTSTVHPNFYQSHLHHRRRPSGDSTSSFNGVIDKIPPYTPPPMLSPIRAGSGLYCMTPVTPMFNRQKSMDGAIPTIIEEDETLDPDEELVRSSEPRINIGDRFQAVVPDHCIKNKTSNEPDKADKVWSCSPTKDSKDVFKHVEQFMELSCSAVVPFGGSNKEFALDCLTKSKGDILAAVKLLVQREPNKDESTLNMTPKCYSGSGRPWTAQEIKLFDCAMLEHRKDFFVISKMVKTRTTAECVDRYYHVVKRHRRRVRLPRRYRDQENDNILSVLAASPVRNIKEGDSSSSSDEESSIKSRQHAADHSAWLPQRQHRANSPAITSYSRRVSPPPITSEHSLPKPLKSHTARFQHSRRGSPSPGGSPSSNVSTDEPAQVFTCPVCGKSFGKVKSRNAHMKTHGKQAQEKRRQREEEAARRREEMAGGRPPPHHQVGLPIHRGNFVHPPTQLFQHPQIGHSSYVMPRFGSST